jgi:hypothetical protein
MDQDTKYPSPFKENDLKQRSVFAGIAKMLILGRGTGQSLISSAPICLMALREMSTSLYGVSDQNILRKSIVGADHAPKCRS